MKKSKPVQKNWTISVPAPNKKTLIILILVMIFIMAGIVFPMIFIGDGLNKFSRGEWEIAHEDREMAPSYFDAPLARPIILGYEVEKITKTGDDTTFCGQGDSQRLPPGKFERMVRIYTFFGLTFGRIKIDCNEALVL